MNNGQTRTHDGRYIIVRGRLWRATDPTLSEAERQPLVDELMSARSAKRTALKAQDREGIEAAKARVQAAKEGLGERGEVWWKDGAPDENRKLARSSTYAEWWASQPAD